MRRFLIVVSLVWAMVALAMPLGLSWTGRGTAPELENRRPSQFPNEVRPHDVTWFTSVTTFVEDRLALASGATRALRTFDLEITDRLPAGDVLVGQEPWLFLRETLRAPCLDEQPLDRERELLERLWRAADARGIRVVLAVMPDKLAMEPEHAPAAFRSKAKCLAKRAEQSQALAKTVLGADNVIPVTTLLDTKPSSFHPTDSHWTAAGRRAFMQDLVERAEPGMWDAEAVDVVPGEREMDLLALAGVPEIKQVDANAPRFAVESRVKDWLTLPRTATISAQSAPGRRLIGARTLMLHDSFVAGWREEFTALFADATIMHWSDLESPEAREVLPTHDLLVLETVGRAYWGGSPRIAQVVEALEARVREPPM